MLHLSGKPLALHCILRTAASRHLLVTSLLLAAGAAAPLANGAELDESHAFYRAGKYEECIAAAKEAMARNAYGEDWPVLKIDSELRLGRYTDALQTLEGALKRFPSSIRLRWVGHLVFFFNQKPKEALKALDEISEFAKRAPYFYNDSANRVALGRYYVSKGADARSVLETFYDPVKKDYPGLSSAYIAAGELALSKNDYALAAEEFESALKRSSDDPEIHWGLAKAFFSSDAERANKEIETALRLNPHHVESMLFVIDHHIDAERYDEAENALEQILKLNALQPDAWAYRAVLAHLRGDSAGEKNARDKALTTWPTNPEVDHLIGRKLSEKYRFAEGAEYQRRALKNNRHFLPAHLQLSQDLLRIGQDEEGWRLANLVFESDQYNVVAHNLVQLKSEMDKFRTLETPDFLVRMDAHEAALYGDRVLQLLTRAKAELCDKYDVVIDEPVIVDIFPRQQDFAIRTFGLPGGAGFLGVCFGRVITANSPASQGNSPSNLESVLWHEFCHVVTLQKTRNRMPRWLSEGISVYEERQANPAWGQSMDPQYRTMILGGQLTPVSKLSGAFLQPPSPLHLQFAYYEASLVTEYLIEEYGLEVVKRLLTDLGVGMPINESLQRYAGSLDALDAEFAKFAMQRAHQLAPQATWEEVVVDEDASADELAEWLKNHPKNFPALQQYAKKLLAEDRAEEAIVALQKLVELYPEYVGPDSAYRLLATIYHENGETDRELEVLNNLAKFDADATAAYLRLMEISSARGDWAAVRQNAERMLAVNPLVTAPHRFLAQAADQLKDTAGAVRGYQALLQLDPTDPAEIHYRLAWNLKAQKEHDAARRHVLKALEEAPRYREAHQLLLELAEEIKEETRVNRTVTR
jgi:tetratricopeptide (TPR) repeat protein